MKLCTLYNISVSQCKYTREGFLFISLVTLTHTVLRFDEPVPCLAESYTELYCFSYKPNVDEEERRQEWEFLDLKADYSRMGLPNSLWKLSPVNRHYKVSEPTFMTTCTFSFLIWASRLLLQLIL